ncbi:hypothetical protein ACFOOP_05755 [Marinicaulis aureus]|uniref:Antifreeze protein n=1 Tax=Hyphococcus aureus TaxID=2666033 RepID=A0ABW1KRW0_9PROT
MMKKVVSGALGAGLVLFGAQAFAGEWKFNPRACPDLVEDRYDRIEDRRDYRTDYGRRDRREDRHDRRENRRDEAITVCPSRAFYYQPDRRELRRANNRGRGYAWGHEARPPVKYDRRIGMYYRYAEGRKIYIRG